MGGCMLVSVSVHLYVHLVWELGGLHRIVKTRKTQNYTDCVGMHIQEVVHQRKVPH